MSDARFDANSTERRCGTWKSMKRSSASTRLLPALALAIVLPGCAELLVPDQDIRRLRTQSIDPCQVAFVVHGMLKDTGIPWDTNLRDDLSDHGQLGLVTTYWSDPIGVWFNSGSEAPAALIAGIADDIALLHHASGCPVPLSIRAVGFSNGAEVLLDAADALRFVSFETVVFAQSSSFAFSSIPDRLISDGKIGRLEVHWSPFDVVTLLAPLGAGQFGLWSDSPQVSHHRHWRWHIPPLLQSSRDHYREALFPAAIAEPWTPERVRFAEDLARFLERRRSRKPSP